MVFSLLNEGQKQHLPDSTVQSNVCKDSLSHARAHTHSHICIFPFGSFLFHCFHLFIPPLCLLTWTLNRLPVTPCSSLLCNVFASPFSIQLLHLFHWQMLDGAEGEVRRCNTGKYAQQLHQFPNGGHLCRNILSRKILRRNHFIPKLLSSPWLLIKALSNHTGNNPVFP